MAKVCQVTGKGPMVAHKISHSNIKTKRRVLPNLQARRFWVPSLKKWLRLRVSAAGIKIIDKIGIDQVVADMKARGERF